MKSKKKSNSGSIKVDPAVLLEAKEICDKKGVKVNFYATEAIKEKNIKESGTGGNKKA